MSATVSSFFSSSFAAFFPVSQRYLGFYLKQDIGWLVSKKIVGCSVEIKCHLVHFEGAAIQKWPQFNCFVSLWYWTVSAMVFELIGQSKQEKKASLWVEVKRVRCKFLTLEHKKKCRLDEKHANISEKSFRQVIESIIVTTTPNTGTEQKKSMRRACKLQLLPHKLHRAKK